MWERERSFFQFLREMFSVFERERYFLYFGREIKNGWTDTQKRLERERRAIKIFVTIGELYRFR